MDDGLTYPEIALQLLQLLLAALVALTRLPALFDRQRGAVADLLPATDAHEPAPAVIGPGEGPSKGRPMLCQGIGWWWLKFRTSQLRLPAGRPDAPKPGALGPTNNVN